MNAELVGKCLLWLFFVWLGLNALALVFLVVLARLKRDEIFDVLPVEKPEVSKRTWAKEMGLRLPR